MRRLILSLTAAAALLALPARAAITLDTSVCSGGAITSCTSEHVSGTVGYTSGTTTTPVNVPTSLSCSGSGTVLYALIEDENHGSGTTTGAPVIAAGTSGNYSTQWTLVSGSNLASTTGGVAIYRAVCASSFSGEVPKLTLSCSGGTATCSGTNAAVVIEAFVQFVGFSTVFPTPGTASASSSPGGTASGTPSRTITTSSGDKLLMVWDDFSGGNCAQTLTSGAAIITLWETPGALNAGCNGGNDNYYFAEWTSGTTSAGSTTIGVTSPTTVAGAWAAVEICDSTASACPNVAAGTAPRMTLMGVGP